MNEKEFIQKFIIEDIEGMQKAGFHYFSFVIIAQAMETLGAFLDNKPFRAQNQSKKRFASSLYNLFDKRYSICNKNNWFYDKFRNHMAHMLIPSSFLIMTTIDNNKYKGRHLMWENEKLILIAEELQADVKKAAQKLIKQLEDKKIPAKKIATTDFVF